MKKRTNPAVKEALSVIMEEYKPTSILEIQEVLTGLFADTMEKMLQGELDSELGYPKHNQAEKATTNRRNGSYRKKVRSTMGELELSIPRDRDGAFEPELVPTGTKDVSGLEEKVLSMYAKGLSDRDISDVVEDIYQFSISHDTISKIVDRVMPRVTEWQTRPLQSCYPFLFIDALRINVKDNGKAHNKAVYSVIGINEDGYKDVLGFWIHEQESAHFWMTILDEIKERGVQNVGFISMDGLTGLADAAKVVFPNARPQRCIVHLVRSSIKYIPSKHYKAFCADLKNIYRAVNVAAAELAFEDFKKKWSQYPGAVKVWSNNFDVVIGLFDYPTGIRKMIYTTNMIESFNSALRKVTNRKAAFPNDYSVLKILFLRTMDIVKKRNRSVNNWAIIRGELDIVFPHWNSSQF